MTLPSSTTSTAGSVTLDPTSPDSVSTVRTSSTAAFSCLPPQRTIAYTEELSLCLCGPVALFPQPRTRHEVGLVSSAPGTLGNPALDPSCALAIQAIRPQPPPRPQALPARRLPRPCPAGPAPGSRPAGGAGPRTAGPWWRPPRHR